MKNTDLGDIFPLTLQVLVWLAWGDTLVHRTDDRQGGTRTRRGQRGAGRFKAIAWTVLLVFAAYAAFKIIPVYIAEYQLADKMQEQARFAVVNHYTEDQIRTTIYKTAQELDIPVAREQIKVLSSQQLVQISLDYTVPVDLIVYRVQLHFTPSSENRSLF